MGSNPRFWAAIGNVLKIPGAITLLSGLIAGANTVPLVQSHANPNLVITAVVITALLLVIGFLFWNAKPALISGRPWFARWLVGAYVVFSVVSTFGLVLLLVGLAYLVTPAPSKWDYEPSTRRAPSRGIRPPPNWTPDGKVGLSGATVYTDPDRTSSIGTFYSGIPVQVLDRQGGYAHVVAATGDRGWIDIRTLAQLT